MRFAWLSPAPLVMLAAGIGAPGASGKAPESPRGRYQALVRDYQTRQLAFHKAINRAKTNADRRKALSAKPSPAEYAERFLELARAGTERRSRVRRLELGPDLCTPGPESDKALGLLAREHVGNKRLGPVLQRLLTWRSPPAEDLLRAALARSPHREARAQACYALATVLTAKARQSPGPTSRTGRARPGLRRRRPPPSHPRGGRGALRDAGHRLWRRPLRAQKTYADLARAGLARLRPKAGRPETRPAVGDDDPGASALVGLDVGMRAPEIEGLDTKGGRCGSANPGRRGRARLLGPLVTPLPGHVPARAVARDASARQAVRPDRDQQRQEPRAAPSAMIGSRSPGGRGGTAAAPAGRSPPCSASDRGRRSSSSTTRA